MARLITVYWRDIPAQVIAKAGRQSVKVQLADRFQEAIDRAAMRAGKGGSEAYLEEWRRETTECGDDIEVAAREHAASLEASIDDERLQSMIRARGRHPENAEE
jgi:hypothetical protein